MLPVFPQARTGSSRTTSWMWRGYRMSSIEHARNRSTLKMYILQVESNFALKLLWKLFRKLLWRHTKISFTSGSHVRRHEVFLFHRPSLALTL